MRDHECFKQRVAGQSICAMQPRASDLSRGKQPFDLSFTVDIRDYTTALIVRGRHHRNWCARHVETKLQTYRIDVWKTLLDEVSALVSNVQPNAIHSGLFHLGVNGAGDDIARRKLATLVITVHKPLAVRATEHCALATDCFADKER